MDRRLGKIRSGTGHKTTPKVYPDELQWRVADAYITLRVLNYHTYEGMIGALSARFGMATNQVRYILLLQGLRRGRDG